MATAAAVGRRRERQSRHGLFLHAPRFAPPAPCHRRSEPGLALAQLDISARGDRIFAARSRAARRPRLGRTFRFPGLLSVGRGAMAGSIRKFCRPEYDVRRRVRRGGDRRMDWDRRVPVWQYHPAAQWIRGCRRSVQRSENAPGRDHGLTRLGRNFPTARAAPLRFDSLWVRVGVRLQCGPRDGARHRGRHLRTRGAFEMA